MFKVVSPFTPQGDQPEAIEKLSQGVLRGDKLQVLLGVTGSGKTYTMAKVIEKVQKPTLVLAHNKTLAAQLCSELKGFFPDSAVEYFVSYYDYYQPEAYIASSDTYIEKTTAVNEEIDRLRHSATCALNERKDVIIVASVSCIYALGDPEEYLHLSLSLRPGMEVSREEVMRKLVDIQFQRNDLDFQRGTFRVRGDTLDIFPMGNEGRAIRVSFFGDEIERITEINTLTGEVLSRQDHAIVFPASHYATGQAKLMAAMNEIERDMESHVTIPQIGAMYRGDRMRKEELVKYGFRLPSAFDNRPLRFEEFLERIPQMLCVSATPGPWELSRCSQVAEQIIRPTGLVDPEIFLRPIEGQIDDILSEVRLTAKKGYRTLITTLTKRMAEDLTEYLDGMGVRVRYMHSDIDTLDRMEIIRDLRLGEFDVLVGINLLREGLDLPEVGLVAILDADKEGFLRSETSLIQTIGRAARNAEARVLLYADTVTPSMQRAMDETERRRKKQMAYNAEHGITPRTIRKEVSALLGISHRAEAGETAYSEQEKAARIEILKEQMQQAARELEFEEAAKLRDEIKKLMGETVTASKAVRPGMVGSAKKSRGRSRK